MKYIITLLIIFLAGCSQPANTGDELQTNLSEIHNRAVRIIDETPNVQPAESAAVIHDNAEVIRVQSAKASGQVKVIVDENTALAKENKQLKGITTLDWIIAGALTLGLIIAASKISKVFWWAVPVPAFGLVLSQLVSAVLNNLGMILLVVGLFASLAVIAWLYAAFKGNVQAIQTWKKVLPDSLVVELFGKPGETGLAGKTQPKSTQELVKKVKGK